MADVDGGVAPKAEWSEAPLGKDILFDAISRRMFSTFTSIQHNHKRKTESPRIEPRSARLQVRKIGFIACMKPWEV